MTRTFPLAAAVVAAAGLVGCDKPTGSSAPVSSATSRGVEDLADKAKDALREGAEKGKAAAERGKELTADALLKLKESVLQPVIDALPKIEDKMKGMSGQAKDDAKAAYEALKQRMEEFKANPSEGLGRRVTEAFEEVKKRVGL